MINFFQTPAGFEPAIAELQSAALGRLCYGVMTVRLGVEPGYPCGMLDFESSAVPVEPTHQKQGQKDSNSHLTGWSRICYHCTMPPYDNGEARTPVAFQPHRLAGGTFTISVTLPKYPRQDSNLQPLHS